MTDGLERVLNEAGYKTQRLDTPTSRNGAVWGCKIGVKTGTLIQLPGGADSPMRDAIEEAFKRITGIDAEFCFSGWGADLTEAEKECLREDGGLDD